MASSSSSSLIPSSSLSRNWEYDVFVSFHGEDVRRYVLSHIVKEFKNNGINPFIDNEIKRGELIGPELKKAIHGSRIAIALLSKRYASSSWCLDELVEIMKCKEELGQTVITIFYEVEPTDVRKQTGAFGEVFAETCIGKTEVVAEKWIRALAEVATIAGYHSRNWVNDAAMIDVITADILDKLLNITPSSAFNCLIGMGAHMKRLEPLLRLDLKADVRMIGIWGPSGIGKTTIARFLYEQLSSRGEYQHSALVENIKEPSCSDYVGVLLELKQQFLSKITNQKDFKIPRIGVAEERLKHKKVLVVLDNVTQGVQLDAMAPDNQCFGSGSRVIITTQDRSLLRKRKIPFYKVDYPTSEVAFQIFCMAAFKQKFPDDGFEELSREVTRLSGDLPLGLQVIGSYFYGMSKEEWMENLPRLRTELNGGIQSKLKFSYDALLDVDKDLFLYIACLFKHFNIKEEVEWCLAKNIENVSQRLQVLADKSLISISYNRYIEMHDLLVQLGKEIVRKQSIHEPGKRQFLVNNGDICKVLSDDKTIAASVIGINNTRWRHWDEDDEKDEYDLKISGRALEGMTNLQFLRLRGDRTSMPGCMNNRSPKFRLIKWMRRLPFLRSLTPMQNICNISAKLRVIEWHNSRITRFPFTDLECLVELDMPGSRLEKLWEGNKPLHNLKLMSLSYSPYLKKIPNLSTATSLKRLFLRDCYCLEKLPSSIGNATNLELLHLENCKSLVELPSSIWNATNLQELYLHDCSGLVKLPSFTENATNLRILELLRCSGLVKLPASIGYSTSLEKLDLRGCSSLLELPSSIGNATSLEKLDLSYCSSLVKLPSTIGNLQKLSDLYLERCSKLEALPNNINLGSLKTLTLRQCSMYKTFPGISTNIKYLSLTNTELQEIGPWIKGCSRLQELELNGMQKLVSISQLPDSLLFLNAEDCSSLEKLDCSFCNPKIHLNFHNCFKLNQAARDLIIRTSGGLVVLPGVEVPDYFNYRASQSSVTVKLNQMPLRTSTDFKACILVRNGGFYINARVNCSITSKENAHTTIVQHLGRLSLDHNLYIFQFGVKDVTSTEHDFKFWLHPELYGRDLKILECGVLQLVELHDENYEASDKEVDNNESSKMPSALISE